MTSVAFNSADIPTLLYIWCSVRWSDDIGRRQYKYSEDATQSSLNIIIYQVRRVRCCVTAYWQSNYDCVVFYSNLLDSILSQLNSAHTCVVCLVLRMVMRHDEFNSDQNTVSAWSQSLNDCWCSVLTVLFFLSLFLYRSLAFDRLLYYIVSRDRLVLVFATRIL